MPALGFSSGKLTAAWYDQRFNDQILVYTPETGPDTGGEYTTSLMSIIPSPGVPDFSEFIADQPTDVRRQTIDVRAAQMIPACSGPPAFGPSVQVSSYEFGWFPAATETSVIQQLQLNPPNLPMFANGTEPFFGDYMDVAGSTFLPNHNGTWRYNSQLNDPDFTHVVWTDNRDVVQPGDGNWADYVPPTFNFTNSNSIFEPGQQRPACGSSNSNQTGDRNQNIYKARLTPGISVTARTNFKQLGMIQGSTTLIERQFPIIVENDATTTNFYKLTIVPPQPTGGSASFVQLAPVTMITVPVTTAFLTISGNSSGAQSVFVQSTDPHAEVQINVVQVTQPNNGGTVVPNGQTGSAVLNGDISNPNIANPNIANPNIANPNIANPNIANAEVYNPNIANPNIANPNIANPNIANPNIANPNIANPNIANINIANPNIANPNIANPNIANPNIANPNIANPNIANQAVGDGIIVDGNWTVTNYGNTASSYNVMVNPVPSTAPANSSTQLVLSQYYTTPTALGCTLTVQSHSVPVSNTITPKPATPATLALQPGESALITYRFFDPTTTSLTTALTHLNPLNGLNSVVSQGLNTNGSNSAPVTPPNDVSTSVLVTNTGFAQVGNTTSFTTTITVRNTSAATLQGPLYLLLSNLPTNVTVLSSSVPMAVSPGGPYFLISKGPLIADPNAVIRFTVTISNPPGVKITFTPKVFSGSAP